MATGECLILKYRQSDGLQYNRWLRTLNKADKGKSEIAFDPWILRSDTDAYQR